MRNVVLVLAAAALVSVPALSWAADTDPKASSTFSDADKAAIKDIVKEYLTKEHPEVVMQAAQELQKREQASQDAKNQEMLKTASDKIFNNPDSPVGGNPKGTVTIVEFFDFQCGYCKMSETAVEKIIKENKSVKFIYKDFPILGPASRQASKAALASVKQNKYIPFHDALMNKKDHMTDEVIFGAAKDAGLDIDKLKKDMEDPAIGKILDANIDLGAQIGVRGTPMFIVNEKVYPGALQYDQLKQAVDDAGKKP